VWYNKVFTPRHAYAENAEWVSMQNRLGRYGLGLENKTLTDCFTDDPVRREYSERQYKPQKASIREDIQMVLDYYSIDRNRYEQKLQRSNVAALPQVVKRDDTPALEIDRYSWRFVSFLRSWEKTEIVSNFLLYTEMTFAEIEMRRILSEQLERNVSNYRELDRLDWEIPIRRRRIRSLDESEEGQDLKDLKDRKGLEAGGGRSVKPPMKQRLRKK
jgi:hypothetical protein